MRFKILFTQDGNDLLKRVATKVLDGDLDDTGPLTAPSESTFHYTQYLSRKFVDTFASDRQAGHSIFDEVRTSSFHICFSDSDYWIGQRWEFMCRALEEYEGQHHTKNVERIR